TEDKLAESLKAFDDGEIWSRRRHGNEGRLIWLGCGGSSFRSPLWCWRALRSTRPIPARSAGSTPRPAKPRGPGRRRGTPSRLGGETGTTQTPERRNLRLGAPQGFLI